MDLVELGEYGVEAFVGEVVGLSLVVDGVGNGVFSVVGDRK